MNYLMDVSPCCTLSVNSHIKYSYVLYLNSIFYDGAFFSVIKVTISTFFSEFIFTLNTICKKLKIIKQKYEMHVVFVVVVLYVSAQTSIDDKKWSISG
jgi:hypothetical protein